MAAESIAAASRQMAIGAAYHLEDDILEALLKARDEEKSGLARNVLETLIFKADIASRDLLPVPGHRCCGPYCPSW